MSSVYDFQDEEVEMQNEAVDSTMSKDYEAVKKKIGFLWWSVKSVDNKMKVIMDGKDMEECLREFAPGFSFGHILDVKTEDHLGVKVHGSSGPKNGIYLAVYDFCESASEISKRINKTTVENFCETFQLELINLSSQNTEVIDGSITEHQGGENHRQEAESCETGSSMINIQENENATLANESEVQQEEDLRKGEVNPLLQEASRHFLGEFSVPLSLIQQSKGDNALREVNPLHKQEIMSSFRTEYDNGHQIAIPSACGFVLDTIDVGALKRGEAEVELLDGNHTHVAMKELRELYPEEEIFQKRNIRVYKGLNDSSKYMLSMLCNEEACNSLKTSQFEKVVVMRKEMYRVFNGTFSKEYQQHIYKLFNALCPNDTHEEHRRKKNLQHLLRISTMEASCWDLTCQIVRTSKSNSTSLTAFRELGNLSVEQSLGLLQKVLSKELKLAEMRKEAFSMKAPPGAALTFQRLRASKQPKGPSTDCPKVKKQKSTIIQRNVTCTDIPLKSTETDESVENEEMDMEQSESIMTLQRKLEQVTKERDSLKSRVVAYQGMTKELDIIKKERDTLKCLVTSHDELEKELDLLKKENKKLKEGNESLSRQLIEAKEKKLTEEKTREKEPTSIISPTQTETMPFSLGAPLYHSTPVKEKDQEPPKEHVLLVEYNKGAVYFGRKQQDRIEYCRAPLGKITNNVFKKIERRNSFCLDPKDTQIYNDKYLIKTFEARILGNIIEKDDVGNYEVEIQKYLQGAL